MVSTPSRSRLSHRMRAPFIFIKMPPWVRRPTVTTKQKTPCPCWTRGRDDLTNQDPAVPPHVDRSPEAESGPLSTITACHRHAARISHQLASAGYTGEASSARDVTGLQRRRLSEGYPGLPNTLRRRMNTRCPAVHTALLPVRVI